MNIFAFISLIGAIISLAMAIFSYTKNPHGLINRVFALLCFVIAFYASIEFGIRQADSFEEAYYWFIFIPIYPLIASCWIHFSLVFSNKYHIRDKKWVLLFIYLFGIVLIFLNYYIYVYKVEIELTNYGWDYGDFNDPLSLLFQYCTYMYMLFFMVFGLYLDIWVYLNTSDNNKKQQAKLISIGCLIPISLFIIVDFLVISIFMLDSPSFSTIGYAIACIFISYAIWKYELFSLDLSSASEKIFSTISDCLILTDPKGKILSINQVLLDLLSYQEKELIEKSFLILLSSEQDRKLYNYQFNLLTTEEKSEFLTDIEIDFNTKANEKIRISLTASKICNQTRNLQGIIYIGRNINKTRKIEKQLDEAIKISHFKSKFMASMSHELRTPLNTIIGFVDLLLEDYCGPLNTCQTNFLTDVKVSSNDLLELISRLLDLSKIEAEKLILEKKEIQITSILDHIYSILKPVCVKKDLDFTVENLATSEFVKADYLRLKEILLNLLDNAIKFTRKGGVILRVKEQKACLEFYVIDTGIGIAEGDFSNIFNEFSKVQNPEIKDTQGMGLGLAITKQLVLLHGGQISFSSELGKGSTFKFTIPKEKM